jgi:hypothetical protein
VVLSERNRRAFVAAALLLCTASAGVSEASSLGARPSARLSPHGANLEDNDANRMVVGQRPVGGRSTTYDASLTDYDATGNLQRQLEQRTSASTQVLRAQAERKYDYDSVGDDTTAIEAARHQYDVRGEYRYRTASSSAGARLSSADQRLDPETGLIYAGEKRCHPNS